VKDNEALRLSVRAFLEVGNERNRLIHQDYATFPLEKTFEEIFALYQRACLFVETLPAVFRECDAMNKRINMEVPNQMPEDASLCADFQH
jgi:hypothetical protein